MEKDRNGDGVGCVRMTLPSSMVDVGQRARIGIVGRREGNPSWFMIFKCADALTQLRAVSAHEAWYTLLLDRTTGALDIFTSSNQKGKRIAVENQGRELLYTFKEREKGISIHVDNIETSSSLRVREGDQELFEISNLSGLFQSYSQVVGDFLLSVSSKGDDRVMQVDVERHYRPDFQKVFSRFQGDKYFNSTINLMNSSHQDIAWMDSPEKCVIERDTMLLTPVLRDAQKSDNYSFDIEDVLMVKEYLERHPQSKKVFAQLLAEGKISVGATFVQPYEEMYSGEDLVRQFYLGKRWMIKNFPGYEPRSYWNMDVPGRTMQMAQIMKKSGTPYLMISRHNRSLFKWGSPDGSFVYTYSPGHYGDDQLELSKSFTEASIHLAKRSEFWRKYYPGKADIPVFSCQDMLPAVDYSELIGQWNQFNILKDSMGNGKEITLPRINLSTGEKFMDRVVDGAHNLDLIQGERPEVWLYIHGPSHQKALSLSRRAGNLLPEAETFTTVNSLLEEGIESYPHEQFNSAWEDKIFPDHGWGGVHGDITDNLFKQKYMSAMYKGERLLEKAQESIASKIKTHRKIGVPVVVFNSLSWKRSNPVRCDMVFKPGEVKQLKVLDAQKVQVPSQLSDVLQYDDGSIKSVRVHFIAKGVPSVGYKTFYVEPLSNGNIQKQVASLPVNGESIENVFYRIDLAAGGIKHIYDKELNSDLLDSDKFLGGEVFTMQSKGNGAGEFSRVQQPTMEQFDRVANHAPEWRCVEKGPVYNRYRLRQPIKYATVVQDLVVYHSLKRVDLETALKNWEGVLYREFRMALPVAIDNGSVSYEVPFGTVKVGESEIAGAAGERFNQICSQVHPRGICNWIGVSNDKIGVTLTSSVAVADYIDPTPDPTDATLLQPILLASRKSCNGRGNEYLQTGSHYFFNAITSHVPGSEKSTRFGKEVNQPLRVVVNPSQVHNASLPQSMEFFGVDSNNVIISTVKKCEDDQGVVVRLYDVSGKNSNVTIRSFKEFSQMKHTNIIEQEQGIAIPVKRNKVSFQVGHHAIETVKLK